MFAIAHVEAKTSKAKYQFASSGLLVSHHQHVVKTKMQHTRATGERVTEIFTTF